MFVERQVSYSSCKQKNDITQGASGMGKNDVMWDQANTAGLPPDPKINKAESLYKHWAESIELHA